MDITNLKWLCWLLPPVFLAHDLEEIVMLAPWLARHRSRLAELATKNRLARRLVASIDLTPAQFSLAVIFELVIILAATLWAFFEIRPGAGFYFFLILLGAMFLHVFTHLAQPILFRGYTPGLVTAVSLVLPVSLYLYRRFFQAGLINWTTIAWTVPLGGVILLPVILTGHALGRKLIPGRTDGKKTG